MRNSGSHASLMRILAFFNYNEPARDKFENGYGKIRSFTNCWNPMTS